MINPFLTPFTTLIEYFFPENTDIKEYSDLIYFDFETTGLNPYHNKIIEYAFIQEDLQSIDSDILEDYNLIISGLVNPGTKFSKKITEITGIHPDEVEDKKKMNYHISEIMKFINFDMESNNIYLVAHNCDAFDRLFLINAIKKYNKKNPSNYIHYKHIEFIDTLNLAKKLLPNLSSYSMKSLAKYFNVTCGTHRATSDTICLIKIYHKLIELLEQKINYNKQYIIDNPSVVMDYLY